MTALALALFLLAGDETDYPLGARPARSLTEPGRPFVVTDFRYRVALEPTTTQALSTRARVRSWGFLGAFVDDQRRGLSLQTHRFTLGYFEDPSFRNLRAGFRGSRVILDVEAERGPPEDGRRATFEAELAVRLSEDLELFGSYFADAQRQRPRPARPLREERLGLLWQSGTALDLSSVVSRRVARTLAGFDLETLGAEAAASGHAWNAEADARVSFSRTRGPVPRDEAFASLAARVVLADRLLAELRADNRWEPRVQRFAHATELGLRWHARRVSLARAGEAARRMLELVRRSRPFGVNERRAYDEAGRRALRERLALSPRRAELAADLEALHRAEIAERNVPVLGLTLKQSYEARTGQRRRSLEALVGVPWPARWPWQADEAATPFLTLRYAATRTQFGDGFASTAHAATLAAELDRELTLTLRWRRAGITALDVIFRRGGGTAWEVELGYALGR